MQCDAQAAVVDLRLAVNYLPACLCAVQSLVLSFVLVALHAARLVPCYVACGLCLVVDRLQRRTRILDGNSVLLGIFLSHVVSEVQEFGTDVWSAWSPLQFLLSAEWPALAGYAMIYGVPSLTMGGRSGDRLAFAVSCAHVAVFAFQRVASPEPRGVRVMRYLSFSLLSICWMYVIGIYRRRVTHVPTDSSVYFAVYFWPILFVHAYAAVAYAAVVFVFVVAFLRSPPSSQPAVEAQSEEEASEDEVAQPCGGASRRCGYGYASLSTVDAVDQQQAHVAVGVSQSPRHSLPPLPLSSQAPADEPAMGALGDCEESMEDLERAFRLALQSKAGCAAAQ